MRSHRVSLAVLAATLAATLALGFGLARAAQDGAPEPCGSPEPSVEGPAFDPENVCATEPPPQLGPITDPAVQRPDETAWRIFAEINRPVEGQPFWRTWPEQAEVYPPDPDPANPPKWEKIAGPEPALRARSSVQQRIRATTPGPTAALVDLTDPCTALHDAQNEETRINRQTFDYVIENDLWYVEGKAKAFADDFVVNFPTDSREIKANWVPISADRKGEFVTATDSSGQLWGLVAMHVLSKEVPNWIWATFEHASNPCYDKYLRAQDRFGLTPDGKTSPELLVVFEENGLDVAVYSNYRLDGAQVDFTDPTGRPIVLGNSVTEFGFQTTASCMTCHARATTDASGKHHLSVFDEHGQSENGTPDPDWYFASFDPLKRSYLPLDFLWSVALGPNAIGQTKANCTLPAVDE